MTKQEVIELYLKERKYQESIFGDYRNNESLSFASFILFIEDYINRAKKSYSSKWESEKLPEWMIATRESLTQETTPVEAYEDIIKIMALAGAALEAYIKIDIDRWRDNGIKEKWKSLEG